jgi:hypothetical protein
LEALPLLLPPPDQGGRLLEFMRVVCVVAERLELPNPCGAWPESVLLPCAFQLRPEACCLEALLLKVLLGREACDCPCDCDAEGGRLEESCDWRALPNPCWLLPARAELPAVLLPPRLAEKEPEFMV